MTKSKSIKKIKSTASGPNKISGELKPIGTGDHIYLIDGSGYIFRAFHALPPLTRPSDGLPVGAVHGFCQMLWKLIQDTSEVEKPSHLAVILDHSGKTFRNDIYPEYKANRPPAPEDLVPQFPIIRDAVRAFNVACVEKEGFEADDLIATYARQAADLGAGVTIVSSDKDLMQLVSPSIEMLDTMKNRRIGETEVHEKFGVGPERVIDVQSLAGDSTDNVPGVPGIGIKTAALLINEYGDLDSVLRRAEEIKQNKRRENLIEFADQARISRDLVTLKQDVDIDTGLDEMGVRTPVTEELMAFLTEMEFGKLTTRIASGLNIDPPAPSTTKAPSMAAKAVSERKAGDGDDPNPADLAAYRLAEIANIPVDPKAYDTVITEDALKAWIEKAQAKGHFAFDLETNSLDAMQADLVGFSMSIVPGEACYVPVGHTGAGGLDFDGTGGLDQMDLKKALELIKPLLNDEAVLKIGQNLKYDRLVLKQHNIDLMPFDDTMLMSYALDAGRGRHNMDELADRWLGHTCIKFSDVAGTGKAQITFDQVPIEKASAYAAEDADITLRLWHVLKPRLSAEQMTTIYETLERPLSPVLTDMEHAGIKVDRAILARLSGNFAQRLAALEAEVHKLVGEEFNIASPKQMGEILFDKLDLPGGKKTKTGAWATGAGVLEDLASNDNVEDEVKHLIKTVLEWRQLAKLKSTYTDALPEFIHPKTGRIHTSYSMAATTTGRLSSNDPNLQNIPIRTPEGREIRTAFIAEKGQTLVSADYSQIELRVLAHIADIAALKSAFADGLDIHAMTASEMFGVPIKDMDPSVRRRAKAINFGIIYGISAFGLANQLGISRGEASDYIKTYFQRFPGIRDYMEETKEYARKHGYVETIFGRKIHYPEINSKAQQRRAFTERAAINAPIQGSAADIIRRAMVRMPEALDQAKLKATMLLQVHDELIFEVKKADAKKLIKLAQDVMERAPEPAQIISVPLKVEAEAADNWEAAH